MIISPGRRAIDTVKRLLAQAVAVQPGTATQMRRGQLMASILFLLCIPLAALVVNNVYYFLLKPTAEFGWYLVTDLLSLVVFIWLWILNRNGKTRQVGIGSVVVISIGISFLYSPDNPSNGIIMYALPILIASFVVEPRASFWTCFISFLTYTIAQWQTNKFYEYDLTGMTALIAIATITWITSDCLERTIETNNTLYAELQDSYETTLEGWSRALDLRDKETEGHTLRVTELTLRIARAMGFSRRINWSTCDAAHCCTISAKWASPTVFSTNLAHSAKKSG